jgi:hypothetical protein
MQTVRVKKACFVCYVELSARNIILRPHNRADSVEVNAMEAEERPSRLSGRTNLRYRNRNLTESLLQNWPDPVVHPLW